jgi:hypothetical protein
MNRRLISESAYDMARKLTGQFGDGLGEEELRRVFETCFKTCRAGLEALCRQDRRMQHQLRPLEKRHEPATSD